MGASQSGEGGLPEGGDAQSPFSSLPASAQRGWKVLAVSAQSPSSNLGIVPYFSVLVAIDGTRLQGDDESALYPLIRENAAQDFTFLDLATLQTRSVSITPRRGWGGEGLLGLMIKADRFANAHLEALHVLDVHRGSPAEKAGLRAHSDWLLGTSRLAFKGYDQLDVFLSQHDGRSATLLVFNRDTWSVREVQLTPSSQWGGAGALGCDVGLGLLHQIPIDGQHSVRYEADQSMAPAAELTQQQPTAQQTPQQQATEQHQQQPPQEQLQSQPQFQQPEATTLGQLVAQQQPQAHPQQPPQQPQQQQWAPNQVGSSQGLQQYSPQAQQQFALPQSLSPQQVSAQQQPQPTSPERQVQQPPQQAYSPQHAQPAPPPQYGQHPSSQHLSPQQAHVSPQPQHQSPQQPMQQQQQQQPGSLSAALPSFPGSVPFQPVQPQHNYTPAMQQYQQQQPQSFQQHVNAVHPPTTTGTAGVYYAPGASTAFQQQSQQQQPPQQPHVQMQAPQQFVQQPYPQQQQAFAQQPQQYYTQQQQAPQQQQGLP